VPLYFSDDLFRFQTYISGRYDVGPHQLQWLSNVQDMAPVWDDYRGRDVLVGVVGTVDNLHPDLRANYHAPYLGHHDPQRDISKGSPSAGTAMAGIVAADDNGRGLVGMAPDARVFEFTGHRGEAPDVLVLGDEDLPYGAGIAGLTDSGARGGLGRIVLANSPGDGEDSHYFPFRDDPLEGRAGTEDYTDQYVMGWQNSQYTVHSDRQVITVRDITMSGFSAFGSGVEGPMTLVSAPVRPPSSQVSARRTAARVSSPPKPISSEYIRPAPFQFDSLFQFTSAS
jgi:hypothetical protein